MLQREEPEHLAIAAACLEPELRTAFIDALPSEDQASMTEFFSQPRFIEPEILDQLRVELQRLMSGLVGRGRRPREESAR